LFGADAQIDVPVIGYMFDPHTGAVRALLGIPGASRTSEPVSFGEHAIVRAWIAPGAKHALAAAADGKLYRFDLPERTAVEVSADAPEQVVWSPSGRSAALRYSGGRTRVLLNSEAAAFGMEVALDASAADVAVSDDGRVLLAITARGDTKTVAAFVSATGEERVLLSGPGLNRAAFFVGSNDAVVSDYTEGKLYILRSSGELAILGRVEEPTAVAVSADNTEVLVSSASRAVTKIRVSDGVVTTHECGCAVQALERLKGDVFLVTRGENGPAWLFDAAAGANRFTFVPQPEAKRE
jgi:hypothetical protein